MTSQGSRKAIEKHVGNDSHSAINSKHNRRYPTAFQSQNLIDITVLLASCHCLNGDYPSVVFPKY